MKYVSGSLYISQNFTKCSSKPFTYTIHGDKFSEQYLLQILQNNTIVIKHPWQRNNFLDIQAQNFINKQTHIVSEIYGTVHTPQHLFSSSFRIVNSYTRQLPAKKTVKSKQKRIKIFKKASFSFII